MTLALRPMLRMSYASNRPSLTPACSAPTFLGRVTSGVRQSLVRIDKRRRKLLAPIRARRQRQRQEQKQALGRLIRRVVDRRLDHLLQAPNGAPLRGAGAVGPTTQPTLYASPKALNGGIRLVTHLREWCDLRPDDNVLEIGCGGGGPALALTDYLNGDGRYEGLDIMTEPIQRAQAIISKDHPNFRFQVADVYNENYNRHGKFQASEYRFPFPDDTFDVVLLGSVFTHMRPADVDRYLAEIGRVSKPGGRSLVTYFVLNSEALGLIESGASAKKFTHRFDGFRAEDKDIPECAIAYDEEWVRARYAEHRLEIQEPVRYGRWCGRSRAIYPNRQDIVVAVKR